MGAGLYYESTNGGRSMKQKLVIFLVVLILIGSLWFVKNLIEYNNCWDGLSSAVRDEWESTGESGSHPILDFIRRGLGSGCPAGLDKLQEPGATIASLQDAVGELETQQRVLQAEVGAIRKELKERRINDGRMQAEIDGVKNEINK